MRLGLVRKALEDLTEEGLQELLAQAYEADGWTVTNLHVADAAHENGVDLLCEKQGKTQLLAVKKNPVKKDVEQLSRLRKRSSEGELLYVHVSHPTVGFQKEMKKGKGDVTFLGPAELHMLFLRHEVVEYLVRYFATISIAEELAEAVTILWSSRNIEDSDSSLVASDHRSLRLLKDAVLKTRAAVGVVHLQWDDDLMKRTEVRTEAFDEILDDVVRDLDIVQTFTGGNLVDAFESVQDKTPQVLSKIWKEVRRRTDWNHFALLAEKMASRDEVYEFALRFWALPGQFSPIPHSMFNRDKMRFFCSSIVGILKNLAQVAKDLDDAVDWAWGD